MRLPFYLAEDGSVEVPWKEASGVPGSRGCSIWGLPSHCYQLRPGYQRSCAAQVSLREDQRQVVH